MPSVEIPLNTASRPQLQRLNSREILRSLPSEHDALSTSVKRERVRRDAQPVLTTMRRVSAPPLAPKVLEPLRRSKASDATSRLQQIERIEVGHATRKADGHVYYSIDVYTSHNASHIPTNQPRDRRILHARKHPSAPTTSEPDFRIERRFSDFEQLRHTVLDSVQHSHRHYCNFCEGYSMLLLFSTAQPTVITRTLVHSTQSRARLLSKFLNHVLIEFQMNRPRCQFPCHGGAMVPLILHDFLFLGEDDIEDSRSSTSDADSVASSPVAWLRDSETSPVAFLSR